MGELRMGFELFPRFGTKPSLAVDRFPHGFGAC